MTTPSPAGRVVLLEQRHPATAARSTFGLCPKAVPSPALLARAAQLRAEGVTVEHRAVEVGASLGPDLIADLSGCARVIARGDGPLAAHSEALGEALGPAGVRVERVDPWRAGAGPLAYGMAPATTRAHADADAAPWPDPVHPFVLASVPVAAPPEARFGAALDALLGQTEVDLALVDERIPLTMERLRSLVGPIRRAISEHRTLAQLHLRAWPHHLIAEPELLDHLCLLPVGSLDILAASLNDGGLAAMGAGFDGSTVEACLAAVLRAGLAHAARVSLVIGLPGESAEDAVEALNRAVQVAVECRIARLRIALYPGPGAAAPRSLAEETDTFLSAHPSWTAEEVRGMFDFVHILRIGLPQIDFLGPGFLPSWDPTDG